MDRLLATDGTLWPDHPDSCPACGLPADPSLGGSPHPGCLPARRHRSVPDDRVLEHLARELGAKVIGRYSTRFLITGSELPE